jgi:glycosyltransferase involved in cell wall biosynthesis
MPEVSVALVDLSTPVDRSQPEVSVVLPCLNEAETLATCVSKALAAMKSAGINGEVVIADNGSTDGSQELAMKCGARVVNVTARGYGAALRGGIAAARGHYIVMADADDSYDLGQIADFVESLRAGADLVMGNRFRGGIRQGAMPPLHRYLGNPVLSFLGRFFFHVPCGDFHCGMRAFTKSAFERMELRTSGMEFASEMLVRASFYGLKIQEVPTTLSPDGRSRAPHLRTWRDGWRHLRFLLLYSPRWLFLYPGLALMAVGTLLTVWLLPGERHIGQIRFDVDTLLYAQMFILLGFYSTMFSVLTKTYGIAEQLLPPDPVFESIMKHAKLERGIILGVLLIVLGIIGTIMAMSSWHATGFGTLDANRMIRLVSPSVLCFSLGGSLLLGSFFAAVLQIKHSEPR